MKTTVQYFNLFVAGFCAAFTIVYFIEGSLALCFLMFALSLVNFLLFLD